MFKPGAAFSGFSVHDTRAARTFYEETLGLLYPKPDHAPATFTVLNFVVDDLERAVDSLNGRGVVTKIYEDGTIPGLSTDAKGIMWGSAWISPGSATPRATYCPCSQSPGGPWRPAAGAVPRRASVGFDPEAPVRAGRGRGPEPATNPEKTNGLVREY